MNSYCNLASHAKNRGNAMTVSDTRTILPTRLGRLKDTPHLNMKDTFIIKGDAIF